MLIVSFLLIKELFNCIMEFFIPFLFILLLKLKLLSLLFILYITFFNVIPKDCSRFIIGILIFILPNLAKVYPFFIKLNYLVIYKVIIVIYSYRC